MSSTPNWYARGRAGYGPNWQHADPGGGPGGAPGGATWRDPPPSQGWGPRGDGSRWANPWDDAPWNPARFGKGPMIAAMVLGFILWWPVGLLILGYLWWSGQMGCWGRRTRGAGSMQNGRGDRHGDNPWSAWFGQRGGRDHAPPSSGNRAFDEYRSETLRRLEEEQQEFAAYLDRLRVAKDKAEFDQFMAERWQRGTNTPAPPAASPPADQPA